MLWLIFPAYNEKENLADLLPKLGEFLKGTIDDYKILIINDGSTDSTETVPEGLARPLPIQVISHEKNRGIGEVFKTAFRSLDEMAKGGDLAIVLEADGTSDYTLIPAMVEKLRGGNDIVIASRYIKGGAYRNFPLKRHILSLGGNVLLRSISANKKVKDYTIFFRGYRVKLIKNALSAYRDKFITSKTFLANTEALINLTGLTNRIAEVPFVYAYDRKIGKSKMPVLKTLMEYLKFLLTKHGLKNIKK